MSHHGHRLPRHSTTPATWPAIRLCRLPSVNLLRGPHSRNPPSMALSESSRLLAPQPSTESAPAPRRTALPSRPMAASRDTSDIAPQLGHQQSDLPEVQEHPGSDAGLSPTLTRASPVSPAPPSPTHYKSGSPTSQGKTQSGSSQGYIGQVCRWVASVLYVVDTGATFLTGTAIAARHEHRSGGGHRRARPSAMPVGCT